ncbi:MAG: helix-turn-helix domain-containing protein [Planctomycetota bacterium]
MLCSGFLSSPRPSSTMAADAPEPLPCKAFTDAIPKSTASHHWRVLREAGLIWQHPHGTSLLNGLRREDVDQRFPGLLDAVLKAKTSSGKADRPTVASVG